MHVTLLKNSNLVILHIGFHPGYLRQYSELAIGWMTRIQFQTRHELSLCLCVHIGSGIHSAANKWLPDL
jgi:hypothetical protein